MIFKIPHIFRKNGLRFVVLAVIAAVMSLSAADVSAEPKRQNRHNSKAKPVFTVVIDAGHGGHDHGAIDNGAREKDINLGVAKKFADLVRKKLKDVNVVMTRDDDTFISLQERANIANRNKGNLFISIHTNSVDKSNPNRKTVSGTSVYALGPQKDANNLKVAQRENAVIELEDNYHQKYSGFDPSKDESYIIFEMAQKKNLGQSLRFADKAQKELVNTASRKDRGVKQAGFWVLWATSMPAVLVELDFICNPAQAAYMTSESGQQKLAEALFNALKKHVEAYGNPTASINETSADVHEPEQEITSVQDNHKTEAGISTLVAFQKTDRSERREHRRPAKSNVNNGSTARKRRSASSKQISDSRTFETESITLKRETDFLAINETAAPEVKEDPTPPASTVSKEKKDKKKKTKKKKENKKETKSKGGTKTFVVKNGGKSKAYAAEAMKAPGKSASKQNVKKSKSDAVERTGIERASRTVQAASQKPRPTVYTIQLLSSDTEIDSSDPSFCGIVPSGMFKENGEYKYTYGRTESRSEIERQLLEVKTVIPQAFILVRSE